MLRMVLDLKNWENVYFFSLLLWNGKCIRKLGVVENIILLEYDLIFREENCVVVVNNYND